MRVLILNGSPKKRSSTSKFLGRMVGLLLTGCNIQYASLRMKSEYPKIMQYLKDIEALILAAPLYVDGIPSHILEFLQLAGKFCTENGCNFVVYAISNNGFIEGIHNKSHLMMYECWCKRAGLVWGGGVGIGGGEMFHCLAVYYPVAFAVLIAINIIKYTLGTEITFSTWLPLLENIGIYLFFNCGVFYCIARLSASVRKLHQTKNRYTRIMVPAFLFIPMADIFMTITALFNGKIILRC
ncbi:hypothetical protein IMSAG049_00304 [Clostridiales bacterium]|nr:hypothetical protein IMSAG049_00304 [Clostridiales bacterium]